MGEDATSVEANKSGVVRPLSTFCCSERSVEYIASCVNNCACCTLSLKCCKPLQQVTWTTRETPLTLAVPTSCGCIMTSDSINNVLCCLLQKYPVNTESVTGALRPHEKDCLQAIEEIFKTLANEDETVEIVCETCYDYDSDDVSDNGEQEEDDDSPPAGPSNSETPMEVDPDFACESGSEPRQLFAVSEMPPEKIEQIMACYWKSGQGVTRRKFKLSINKFEAIKRHFERGPTEQEKYKLVRQFVWQKFCEVSCFV
jgi:hypothetical protein